MILQANEIPAVERERHLGGEGRLTVRELLDGPEALFGKGRVFAHTTVQPGASIGYHVHNGESEIYYIYSGEAEFNDNGELRRVQTGDVTVTPPGCGHGIRNIGRQPLELIALILYA